MQRLGIQHNRPDREPQFRITVNNGAFQRNANGKGGIDWYRYLTTILLPILIPFGVECQIDHSDTNIEEDKAPAHASHHQQIYYDVADLQWLLWLGNLPDFNMIELAWIHLKRVTTRKGAPSTRAEAE